MAISVYTQNDSVLLQVWRTVLLWIHFLEDRWQFLPYTNKFPSLGDEHWLPSRVCSDGVNYDHWYCERLEISPQGFHVGWWQFIQDLRSNSAIRDSVPHWLVKEDERLLRHHNCSGTHHMLHYLHNHGCISSLHRWVS